jgi:branched-chain amino acid transport system permease protein
MTAISPSSPSASLADRLLDVLRHPATVIALLAAVILLAPLLGQDFWVTLVTRAAILALAALSLGFVLGQGGLVSFGHAAPFGIGAYVVLIAGEYGIRDILLLLPLAFLGSAAFAVPTGALALRTRGVYFIMITLAFAQMAYFVFSALAAFGGDDGMSITGRATLFGAKFLRSDIHLAWTAVGLLAAVSYLLHRAVAARFGAVLRAARDNEARTAALGFSVFRTRLVAYALAAGIAGSAGAMMAEQTGFVSPALMNWHRSGELIVMVVLGGSRRLSGAILGAVAVVLVEEFLGATTEYWKFGLGLLILAVVAVRVADPARIFGRRS